MRSPRTRDASIRSGAFDDDVLSTVSTNSSTVATTASLASRIAGLAIDLEDATAKEQELGTFPEEEEEEEVIEVSEEHVLRVLDAQEDPFQVCSRLFRHRVSNPVPLKRMNIIQMEEFKQHGYLILDNFISKDAVGSMREEALALKERGCLAEAAKLGNAKFQDTKARGDSIMWLHSARPPLDSAAFAPLVVAFQELQSDLSEFMKLRNNSSECQLAYYPPNGSVYKKHRDAFPDDGSDQNQRRVSAVVYVNVDWKAEDGGELRIWPPRKNQKVNHAAHFEQRLRSIEQQNGTTTETSSGPNSQRPQHTYLSRFLGPQSYSERRSNGWQDYPRTEPSTVPAVSEADISISEPSECGSLRSDGLDPTALNGIPKSTTSSVMADLGLLDGQFDVSSIDDMSVVSSYFHEQTRHGVEWVEVDGEMVLDVAPLGGRCVVFLSGAVNHAVMSNKAERFAVTSWLQ